MEEGMMLYLHIPFCVQKCQYCDFLSFSASAELRQQYVEALCREIEAWKEQETEMVTSVFWGGGTPSLLEPFQLECLLDKLYECFHIKTQAEHTIEVNPGTVTMEKALKWKQKGINRVSMGVQAMDDALLQRLGRIHNRKQVIESWQILREAGFDNLSFDLMMGLPGQTLQQWEQTLKAALAMQPRHLSCYSLIIEEGTPFYEQQDALNLPEEDCERAMYESTQRLLSEAGMHQYEISNFSLPGYESRHNTGYWRRKPYIGLGLGASSLLKEQIRCKNTNDMHVYLARSCDLDGIREEKNVLSRQEQMEEFMFLGLRCTQGVRRDTFERCFGCTMESVYQEALDRHLGLGLLEEENGWIRLTARGLDVANQVFADFLLSV